MKIISPRPSHPGIYLAVFLAILLTGCKSAPPPTAEVAVTKATVSDAATAGAAEYAPEEMKSAREKLDRANQAMAAKDYKLAKQLSIEAQADAELARSKANSAKAQQAADALQDDIRVMREELDRNNRNK
ncbi:hypothetical protein CAP31_06055 [Sulfuriferula sp. AH1]|uniref:DUF4398 domain-containing protein n=1 Tax=Sulfuriferula sp. AH1 TaxID=1985873 RepID=UPI000B3B1E52|nr:DUF4398 domain-containing protein [Sulfuriferula sp. AH1]ARU31286.1 hypothetical protein CAP31_06055 [Sulfuriferula sp. AH1]